MLLKEGRAEGRLTKTRLLTQKLLEHKFGELPAITVERLREMNEETLDTIAIRLLDAHSLAELELAGE